MSALDRRRFLKTAGGAAAVAVAAGGAAACAPETAALDHSTMLALAQAILPEELGSDGIQRAVSGFQAWLAGYQPAVEATHGYGTGNLDYTPAHPGPGWAAQLEALDLEAKERFGATFAALGQEQHTEMIRRQIARERVDRLRDPAQARHVTLGLLAYWVQTPEAVNLCYQARIDPLTCRPLAAQAEKPGPLPGS